MVSGGSKTLPGLVDIYTSLNGVAVEEKGNAMPIRKIALGVLLGKFLYDVLEGVGRAGYVAYQYWQVADDVDEWASMLDAYAEGILNGVKSSIGLGNTE